MISTEWGGSNRLSEYRRNRETKWILAAQAGYTLAFEELVTRYEDRIYELASRIMQNQNEAEDVRRSTFVEAHKRLGEFRLDSCFSLWLTGIATKEALRKLRERHPDEVALDHLEERGANLAKNDVADWRGAPEKGYTESEFKQVLSHGISKLKPISRIVFLLCDQEGCAVEDVVEFLGLSLPAVRSRLLRARLKMREYLNRYSGRGNDPLSSSIAPSRAKQKEIDNGRTVSSTTP